MAQAADTPRRFRTEIVLDESALNAIMKAEERLAMPVDIRINRDDISQHVAMAGLHNLKPWDEPNRRHAENMMQNRIDEVTGRHAELNSDGTYHYMSLDDLPDVGRGDYPYKITSTGDMYRYRPEGYLSYNPYGAVPLDLQAPAPEFRVVIEDESALMPHAGEGALSVIWNVHALRRDLWTKGVRGWSYADMLPKEERWRIQPGTSPATQRSLYLRLSHKALSDQLRNIIRMKDTIQHPAEAAKSTRRDYLNALERLGVSLWSEQGMIGFKDGEFTVVFE